MDLEPPPEPIRLLLAWYRTRSRALREDCGYSPEEAFWTDFVTAAGYLWASEDEQVPEVRLSEVLRLYLSIYCEDIAPDMKVQEEAGFLERLRETFYAGREIILESDVSDAGRQLCRLLSLECGIRDIMRAVHASSSVVGMIYSMADAPLPFRLVEDV